MSLPGRPILFLPLLLLLSACAFDTSGLKRQTPVTCGNGMLDDGEVCDGDDLNQKTCESLGYLGGTLACAADCTLDTRACTEPTCGDGSREGFEVCDGADLNGETCQSQGFSSGILLCAADCRSFDTSSCSLCGNGQLDEGETCDGEELGDKSCESLGFFTGTLACLPTCRGLDTRNCTNCGNDRLDINEVCDGTAGIDETCLDHGCRSGTVTCAADCGSLNLSGCYAGHDEDGDGLDDNCDNCPSVVNASQANADNDQIGDDCEALSNPTLVGNLLFFEPFTTSSSTWKKESGNWAVSGDAATGSGNTLGYGNYYLDSPTLPAHGYSVETTFYFTSDPGDLDFNPYAAVVFGWKMDGPFGALSDAWACAWKRRENKLSVLRYETAGWSEKASNSVTSSAGNNQWRRLRADVSAGGITCSYTDETSTSPPVVINYSNASATNGKVGLRINDTSAVFTSFVVYQASTGTTN